MNFSELQVTQGFPVSGGFSGMLCIPRVRGGRGGLREKTPGGGNNEFFSINFILYVLEITYVILV